MSQLTTFLLGIASTIVGALLLRELLARFTARLTFRNVMRGTLKLCELIRTDGYSPDYVVTIDRNSAIVGTILAGQLGFQTVVAVSTHNVRHPDGSRECSLRPSHLPRVEVTAGTKLLVLICFNDTGTSLSTVVSHLKALSQPPNEIRVAALYTSASPKMKPMYFAWEVGRDLKVPLTRIMHRMPWMSKDWRHVLAEERFGSLNQ